MHSIAYWDKTLAEKIEIRFKELFEEVSEEHWSARWSTNLEYDLWSDIVYIRTSYTDFTNEKIVMESLCRPDSLQYLEHLGYLGTLSEILQGWVHFPEGILDPEFVEINEWKKIYF
ncbi:MAG: hypothetical protein ACTSRU_21700 [Candidatus Hodarchaeales archaeon]